jgi:hypothetical protein
MEQESFSMTGFEAPMIEFQFHGGPKDGERIPDGAADDASCRSTAYAAITDDGAPGALLWCTTEYFVDLVEHLSDSALEDLRELGSEWRGHLYEVYRRSRDGQRVRVFLRHLGACPSRTETTRSRQQPAHPTVEQDSAHVD